MIGLLAIWGACFFWVMVFAEQNRKNRGDSVCEYYEPLELLADALLAPFQWLLDMYLYIHKGSR